MPPHRLQLSTGCVGSGISWVVEYEVRPHLSFAQGHPAWAVKQSEMAATCARLRDSQEKPSCESRLVAASARPVALNQEEWGLGVH